MRPLGILLIAASTLLCVALFAPHAGGRDLIAVYSQAIGSIALIMMAWGQLLSTRWFGLQTLFGPLDRQYVLHKWLGIGAMVAIMLHDTIDAELEGPGARGVAGLWHDVGETLGELSLYGLLALVVLSVLTFVPYHLWKVTHKLMGAFFAAGALHYLLVVKPFGNLEPAALYVSVFCLLGLAAYAYSLMPSVFARTGHRYRVTAIEPTGGAVAVTLAPERDGKGLKHRAGEFAFVSFGQPTGSEPHPFTISSAPTSARTVEFTVKDLGDFTKRLPNTLTVGDSARLSRSFGDFTRRNSSKPEVWVAAGVGITPFLAFAEALTAEGGPIKLFYCFQSEANAPHLARLRTLAAGNDRLSLIEQESGKGSRLSSADVLGHLDGQLTDAKVYFCGPKKMRQSLRADLIEAGLKPRAFHFEEFEIRSGIGLRVLAKWIAPKARTLVRQLLARRAAAN